jgi:amino acid transporter
MMGPGHRVTAIGAPDSKLDSRGLTDAQYLARLGYKQELRRALGLFSSFGVQFSSIATISALYTTLVVGLAFFGPASFWSWIIGGSLQVFAVGIAVAELVSAYPLAGGVYQINSRILAQARSRVLRSPWIGWQSGWWIVVAHTVAVGAVAWSMVPFVASWFGVTGLSNAGTLWWALAICALCTLINLTSVRLSALTNNVGVVAEIAAGVLVVVALLVIHHHTQPLSILTNSGGTVQHGQWARPFLFALLLPLFIISSFDSTGNAAEETHDASRKAPLGVVLANGGGLLLGLIFMVLVYVAIPDLKSVMGSTTPIHEILASAIGTQLTGIFQAIAIVSLLANLVVIQLTGARVLWSQARDQQMPAAGFLSKVSRQRVPVNATLAVFAGVVVILIVAAQSATALAVLVALASLAWALAYGLVVSTGLYALVTGKLPKRTFSAGRLSVPIFITAVLWSALIIVIVIWQNPRQVGGGMIGAIAVGAVLYALIPRRAAGRAPATSVGARPASAGPGLAAPAIIDNTAHDRNQT